ncbi:hypothetical protein BDN70DRAFT_723866 [Pholiota conissans]|uniref:Uncharacterized protein n=1 Tax=Pholiota conissans TaxID=109636 RepID=A0A9P5YZR4_9AGAR|nr:hypothetical protein BDN70DRAFT_723866 [Pholiota conissans]
MASIELGMVLLYFIAFWRQFRCEKSRYIGGGRPILRPNGYFDGGDFLMRILICLFTALISSMSCVASSASFDVKLTAILCV